MDIIFHGKQNSEEAAESLLSVLRLFKEQYRVVQFREMHLTVTLVDQQGDDVELIDSETGMTYKNFEVYRQAQDARNLKAKNHGASTLQLVVDNTKPPKGE